MKWMLSMAMVVAAGLSAYWATRVNGEAAPQVRVLPVEAASEPTRVPVRETSERDLSLVRQRLSELTDEMNGLRAMLEKRSTSAPEKPAEGIPPPPPRTPEARAEQERQWHAHMAKVDEAFQGEPLESTWSAPTSAAIRSAVESREGLKGALRDIDCRSQTCKVEIIDDGTGKVQRDLPLLASDLGEALPNVQAEHQDLGGRRLLMTLYLTKSSMSAAEATLER